MLSQVVLSISGAVCTCNTTRDPLIRISTVLVHCIQVVTQDIRDTNHPVVSAKLARLCLLVLLRMFQVSGHPINLSKLVREAGRVKKRAEIKSIVIRTI